ncbi:hypothetical protein XENORESO_013912 [Xenotaenia resolanae]|uniref:Uncharacterized protein n=1 Tax=Xenotaenia resolanae TaxID=208358 RepID=A0ABV0X8I4_9TELE
MILSRLSTNSFRDSKLLRLSLCVPHSVRDLHILSGSGLTDHRPQAWRDKAGQQEGTAHLPSLVNTGERLMVLLLHPGFRSPICRTGFWTDHGLSSRHKSPQTVQI